MPTEAEELEYLKNLLRRIVKPTGANIGELATKAQDSKSEAERYLESGEILQHV